MSLCVVKYTHKPISKVYSICTSVMKLNKILSKFKLNDESQSQPAVQAYCPSRQTIILPECIAYFKETALFL